MKPPADDLFAIFMALLGGSSLAVHVLVHAHGGWLMIGLLFTAVGLLTWPDDPP